MKKLVSFILTVAIVLGSYLAIAAVCEEARNQNVAWADQSARAGHTVSSTSKIDICVTAPARAYVEGRGVMTIAVKDCRFTPPSLPGGSQVLAALGR